MALFDKPDLEKLKREHKYARLIDWADYTKDPALSRQARRVLESDPDGLAEYIYETVYWTRRNSGHSGRRLPRRGMNLIRQASGMAASIGEPMLAPLAGSLRVYDQFGDPDIKTRLLYYSVVFDIFLRMGGVARETLVSLAREKDADIRKQARDTLADLPEVESVWDEWDDWEDDEDDDGEDEEYDDAADEEEEDEGGGR
jgi:hypothetical protein